MLNVFNNSNSIIIYVLYILPFKILFTSLHLNQYWFISTGFIACFMLFTLGINKEYSKRPRWIDYAFVFGNSVVFSFYYNAFMFYVINSMALITVCCINDSENSSVSSTSSTYSDTINSSDSVTVRDKKWANFVYDFMILHRSELERAEFDQSNHNPLNWNCTSTRAIKTSRFLEEGLLHRYRAHIEGGNAPQTFSATLRDIGVRGNHPLFGDVKRIVETSENVWGVNEKYSYVQLKFGCSKT